MSWSDGQHDSGSLYKLPRGSQVLPAKQAGALPPSMGTVQPLLSESGSCPGLYEHWSGYVILERTTPRGVETPPPDDLHDLEHFRESRGGPLCIERERPLPGIFLKREGRINLQVAFSVP